MWNARQDALSIIQDELQAAIEDLDNFVAEVETRLGRTLDALRALRDTLQNTESEPDSAEVEAVRAEIRNELLLDLPAFFRLLEIMSQMEEDLTDALEDENLVSDAIDILVGQHANSLASEWIQEEVDAGIMLDSALFQQPDQPDTSPSAYLVGTATWSGWRRALERRSSDPVIDPHHLTINHIVQFIEDGFEPYSTEAVRDAVLDILDTRSEWAAIRRSVFVEARSGPIPVGTQYANVLAESVIPGLEVQIDNLLALEENGHSISHAVAKLGFSMPAFRRVVELGWRAGEGLNLTLDQWDDLYGISR